MVSIVVWLVQFELTFVRDSGMWNNKSGSFAVDGDYSNDPDADYYHSDEATTALLLLSIDSDALVQQVHIMQRFQASLSGQFHQFIKKRSDFLS